MDDDPATLVTTGWLARHLHDPDLRILDGSWYLPDQNRDPDAEFAAGHIPGARRFDIDAVSDHASSLPHMAPPPGEFATSVGAIGVGDGDQVVIYDGAGLMSAARVWWLFRLMGHDRIAVLDGGLPKWRAEGRPLATGAARSGTATLTPRPRPALVRDAAQMDAATAQILDARSAARFRGDEAEPRPGLRRGHIPGSLSVPFKTLLNPDNTMKSPDDLRQVLTQAGVDLTQPAITTCGSGVTAAIISLALQRAGHTDHALYDGSWAEWGLPGDRAVATGD